MKSLIVDDDEAIQLLLKKILTPYGPCDIAVNGGEGIAAFKNALERSMPYDLVCMDINMPEINGHEALKEIRRVEKELGVRSVDQSKIIMVTSYSDTKNVCEAFFKGEATAYVAKPFKREQFIQELVNLKLVEGESKTPSC